MADIVTAPGVASLTKKCPQCGTVLELTIESCGKCGARVDPEVNSAWNKEKQLFKPYGDKTTDLRKELYERLMQAFTEMDPRERPWCGIGVKEVDLLAVSPTGVTVAKIKEVSGVKKGVVHVPRDWRERWYVEAMDSEKHEIQGNPCEQAERAIIAINDNLQSFLRANGHRSFPRIKCLIIFPDGYDLQGLKDFFILEGDQVVKLNLRNLCHLPEAIHQPTQYQRLDSRMYRKWIEGGILKSNDDSILGTWLDPSFDKAVTESPKRQPWSLRRPHSEEASTEEEELSLSESSQTRPIETKLKGRKLKFVMVITAIVIFGTVGWLASVAYLRRPVSSSRAENLTKAREVIQTPMPQDIPSLSEDEKRDILPSLESTKAGEVQEPELTGRQRLIESASNPAAQTRASDDSEVKRHRIELQIRRAILNRAITGVTVSFTGDTATLQGKVETENQKSAAEQAARSSPGVKEVRNSIEVLAPVP
ncbi:MAG: BON domain-containing protein [Candidatus Binatia bacterium]